MRKEVEKALKSIVHPETQMNLLDGGMVGSIAASDDRVAISLLLPKPKDPFAKSISRRVVAEIESLLPQMKGKVSVEIKQMSPQGEERPADGMKEVGCVVAVTSGKGGVGKSTVAANLAVELSRMGLRVGMLDADIYGPSQPRMLGVEGYVPSATSSGGVEMIVPATAHGVKLMSIGFFIGPDDALVWRGPMATGALKQLIHQTQWGPLDLLLIDMPPGTGDIHLTIIQELRVDTAVVVTTPQQIAVADARRGIAMFRAEKVGVPVEGIIENMSWFTPAELPQNKYYLFGRDGGAELARESGVPLIAQIPIIQSVMESAEVGRPGSLASQEIALFYRPAAERLARWCEQKK